MYDSVKKSHPMSIITKHFNETDPFYNFFYELMKKLFLSTGRKPVKPPETPVLTVVQRKAFTLLITKERSGESLKIF
jgi:hypothetical protein